MKKKPSHEKKWISCEVEHDFFGDDKKLEKEDRKKKQSKDRSKYKKTDQDKIKKTNLKKNEAIKRENYLQGIVLSIQSLGVIVESQSKMYACSLKGVLKKERTLHKNLVVVGDSVLFEPINDQEGTIAYIEPRRSILSRADNLSRKKEQLIAANVDQVLITVSVVNPLLRPFIVDRYIIAAKKGNMEPIIVINKIDLLNDLEDPNVEEQKAIYEEFLDAYKELKVISLSIKTDEGLDQLKKIMENKISVFSGQSGVGKSTIINKITGLTLKIGDVVERTRKGSHTTTMAQLIPLEFGGWCIDTPGIKSFGVWDLKKEEIEAYYQEIHQIGHQCKYPNCSHSHETECAVKEAYEEGLISPLRYGSYLMLLETIDMKHLRR